MMKFLKEAADREEATRLAEGLHVATTAEDFDTIIETSEKVVSEKREKFIPE